MPQRKYLVINSDGTIELMDAFSIGDEKATHAAIEKTVNARVVFKVSTVLDAVTLTLFKCADGVKLTVDELS